MDKDLFVFDEEKLKKADEITTKNIGFWHEAFIDLKSNKIVFISMIIIPLLLVLSIFFTITSKHTHDQAVNAIYIEEKCLGTGVSENIECNKANYIYLSPKIDALSWIPLFNGWEKETVGKKKLKEYQDKCADCVKVLNEYEKNINGLKVIQYKISVDKYKLNGVEDSYAFGTDVQARDLWVRVWFGLLVSLMIGFFAALIDLTLGVLYGSISGYFGGKIDLVMMRIAEIIYSIPSLVILMFLLTFMKPSFFTLIIAIGLTSWVSVARLMRAQVLKIKDTEFILASKTLGADDVRIIKKHIFPNILGQMAIIITFSIPSAIFYEAFLSFIGLGVQKVPSIGRLISDGKEVIATGTHLHLLYYPTLFICLLMLSINVFANGLRDALDPRISR